MIFIMCNAFVECILSSTRFDLYIIAISTYWLNVLHIDKFHVFSMLLIRCQPHL